MKEFSRGSEWRRWDLHVHTPGTNKNDQYEGTTIDDRWNNFYKSILDYIGDGSDKSKSINQLSDENEEKTEIDAIIEEIIMQNDNALTGHEQMLKDIQDYKPSLDKRIYDAVRINNELLNIKNEMAEIGSRLGIEKQLDSLKKQKDSQSKELSISEEDISKYDTAISELTKLKAQLQIIDNDISIINSIDSVVVPVEPDDALSDDAQKDYSDAVSTIKNKADELWKEYKLAIIKKCQRRLHLS